MVSGRSSRIRICQAFKNSTTEASKHDSLIHTAARTTCQYIRHAPMAIDVDFINWLGQSSVPFAVVFTKADKLTPSKAKQNAEAWMKALKETWEELPPYFITSSEKKTGRDEILNYIENINKSLKGDSSEINI